MVIEVLYSREIEFFLNDLVDVLFYKDYFSYLENAENYVFDLKEEIESSISSYIHFNSPKKFHKYGSYYIIVSISKSTSWSN